MLAEAAKVPSFTPGGIAESETEVLIAALEVRLRQHCLEIIAPTVRRTAVAHSDRLEEQLDGSRMSWNGPRIERFRSF